MQVKTVADLKRLPIGTRLRLVHCLMGPCSKLRVLERVNSVDLMFSGDGIAAGAVSHLPIPKASQFKPTGTGFQVLEGTEVAAEYVFEPEAAPVAPVKSEGLRIEPESPEVIAARIYTAFQQVNAAHANREPLAQDPGDYLARELDGKTPAVAALIGFRMAQALRSTPAGDLQASALHALLGAIRSDEEKREHRASKFDKGDRVTGQPKTWPDGTPILDWPNERLLGTVVGFENLAGVLYGVVQFDSGSKRRVALSELYKVGGGA